MNYLVYSLNGAWEMQYTYEKYTGTELPVLKMGWIDPDDMKADDVVENAVPGYWEDMTESFRLTNFFRKLKINPDYGIQKYPMAGTAPDMALPNIIGNFYYSRSIQLDDCIKGDASIYFGGVQNAVSVWINNTFIGRHEGYSAPFEMKIEKEILKSGENHIFLSVSNHRLEGYDGEPISGLTSRAANECTGGITGDVELRFYTCPLRDVAVLISNDCKMAEVRVEMTEEMSFQWFVCDAGRILKSGVESGDFSFDTDGLDCWSPENPKLYQLKLMVNDGSICRDFGVRKLKVDGVHFRLNNRPYFLAGICEHCYFPETIHPNHDYVYYRSIIRTIKELGFNFIRFHTYVPEEEYMRAADELGILIQIECPNNTTDQEWEEIIKFCRRHTSVVIYCSGNELLLNERRIEYLRVSAEQVHGNTDALYCPMSSLRGVDDLFFEKDQLEELVDTPFRHHARRFRMLSEFSDLYSTASWSLFSYISLDADPERIDKGSEVYNKPRISHEICIDGTYVDLSLRDRYIDTRVGKTELFQSVEQHLKQKGLLKKASIYFKNSSEWQRRIRKYCFEAVRRCENIAGYDFLGPIDTHWHTFGYNVGMMNEFYELKPGETSRNVLRYNASSVLLNDLGRKTNYACGETIKAGIYISLYDERDLDNVELICRLYMDGMVVERQSVHLENVRNGCVSKLYDFMWEIPVYSKPKEMKLSVTLEGGSQYVENEWELYAFPCEEPADRKSLIISEGMEITELCECLNAGKDILLLGTRPFVTLPTSFRIALAGRTAGNLATVINDHPLLSELPHNGFCGWQFGDLLEGGNAICFESDDIPFDPIIEVVSTHKFAVKQAALFEFYALNGRLLVCSFDFKNNDPAAKWLLNTLINYASGEMFDPRHHISESQLVSFANCKIVKLEGNINMGLNPNDITAFSKKNSVNKIY